MSQTLQSGFLLNLAGVISHSTKERERMQISSLSKKNVPCFPKSLREIIKESQSRKLYSDSIAKKNRREGTSLSALTRLRRPTKLIKPSEILRGKAKKWRHRVGAAQGCKQSFDVDGASSQTEPPFPSPQSRNPLVSRDAVTT